MTLIDGLLLGFIGLIVYVSGFSVAYIVYERHRKNIERIEADKEKKNSYDFS